MTDATTTQTQGEGATPAAPIDWARINCVIVPLADLHKTQDLTRAEREALGKVVCLSDVALDALAAAIERRLVRLAACRELGL